jgi:carboxymethylenebutenolidase
MYYPNQNAAYSNVIPLLLTVANKYLSRIGAVVSYGDFGTLPDKRHLVHMSGSPPPKMMKTTQAKVYKYPNTSRLFTIPCHPDYNPAAAGLAHTRSLTFLKPLLGGPYFNLEVIWDEHTAYEFAQRSVESTMSTMVQEPYVNHVPTMTGGIGREKLTAFYRDHFIFSNPDDTGLTLISRTVGVDRVVDEFLFHFTHDRVIDWM